VALTPRGKKVAGIAGAVVAVIAVIGIMLATDTAPEPLRTVAEKVGVVPEPPTPCPLTGKPLGKEKEPPARPALAVKVENTSEAYPLSGLNDADVIYEEVVEGGITRFVSIYHCGSSERVGPVRSARTTDPKILLQLQAHPFLGYSGAAPKVVRTVDDSGVIGMTEADTPAAFGRDDARVAPHNLYANASKLWAAGAKKKAAEDEGAPVSLFTYDPEVPTPSKKASAVTVTFSSSAVAEWRWEKGSWVRYLDGSPMALEDGDPIATDNLVIQEVEVSPSDIVDVSGYPSPEVELLGKGRAWILRNGKLIVGRWERAGEGDVTVFVTKAGDEIPLKPGTAFVELVPSPKSEFVQGDVAFAK
jgi:hypothetical protein